ncbi:MAG: EFR1 family ferrodoxin [Bacteroidales bacterium]|nr:EFR1 family ferrodoxin [Bacteroidales bacterium]
MKTPKKIILFYFSGTGNARQISLWISEFASKSDIDCRLFDISKTQINELLPIDPESLIIFISPVHGFNYPKITLNFISHFPKGKNNIVLMNTRAGMRIGRWVTPGLTGTAFLFSSFLLKRKGYTITGQIPFDMPSNWISIHPALREKSVKFLHEKNYSRVKKHADKIFAGKKDFLAYRDLFQDILISPVSLGYYLAGRFAFAKSFYANTHCDNCGLCIKQCPVQAIKMVNNRPFWTIHCESCMKCMNTCPKKAIETAHGLFFGLYFLSSSVITYLFYLLFADYIQPGFIRLLLFTIVFMALLLILYRIQHIVLKNKFIGKLISFTSLTNYKFWGRYKSIPDSGWKK